MGELKDLLAKLFEPVSDCRFEDPEEIEDTHEGVGKGLYERFDGMEDESCIGFKELAAPFGVSDWTMKMWLKQSSIDLPRWNGTAERYQRGGSRVWLPRVYLLVFWKTLLMGGISLKGVSAFDYSARLIKWAADQNVSLWGLDP